MARVLAALYAAGGALGLVALLFLPLSPATDKAGSAAIVAGAFILALLVLTLGERLPVWSFHLLLAGGTVAVTLAAHFNEEPANDNEMLYLWVSLYAFYFFDRPAAFAHTALIAAAYATVLVVDDTSSWISAWLVTVGTLLVTGILVAVLRRGVSGTIAHWVGVARTDPLTGLLNRRGFEELFEVELARARRTERPLSVLVGDLDNFKVVNDSHGHAAGDLVLQRMSQVLDEHKRTIDTAARIGGEEFALLAPESEEHGAHALAERLRCAVDHELEAQDAGVVTISFGVAAFPTHGDDAGALLRAADRALYDAKAAGRNRSMIYAG